MRKGKAMTKNDVNNDFLRDFDNKIEALRDRRDDLLDELRAAEDDVVAIKDEITGLEEEISEMEDEREMFVDGLDHDDDNDDGPLDF